MAKVSTKVLKKRFLAHLATAECGGVVTTACQKTPIDQSTPYKWKVRDPKFGVLMDEACEVGRRLRADMAENGLFKNVLEGNVTAQIFTLKSLRPEIYGDKVSHEHGGKGGGPVEVEMPGLASWLTKAAVNGNKDQA